MIPNYTGLEMRVYFYKDNSSNNSFSVYELCYTQLTLKNMKILHTTHTKYVRIVCLLKQSTGLFKLQNQLFTHRTFSSYKYSIINESSCEKIQHGNHRV